MSKFVIALIILLLIPFWAVTLNYQVWLELLNGTFDLFNIPSKGSHVSLGTWATLVYLILFPVLQLICFWVLKVHFGCNKKGRILISAITLVSMFISLFVFNKGIILIT